MTESNQLDCSLLQLFLTLGSLTQLLEGTFALTVHISAKVCLEQEGEGPQGTGGELCHPFLPALLSLNPPFYHLCPYK